MKQITRILVTASVLLVLFQIDGVFAEAQTTAAKWQTVTDSAIEILNFLIGIFSFLISPLIALAGWLLSPDWTMGDIFGLRGMLHKFWVTISNVTYFIYAIALIIMALASMFNVENYGVKKLLPKFALGILMVPMTWWFVQATVSLANILTVSIVQIPFDALKWMQWAWGNGWYTQETIPKEITYDETIAWTGTKFKTSDCKTWGCISIETMMTEGTSGPFSMLNAYGYWIFRIQDIKVIAEDTGKSQIKWGVNIVNKLFYGAIVFLAFSVIIIALIAALFKRAILLWIYAMFSPLFSLAFFLPDWVKKWLDLFDYKKFIGLAFVPVYAAWALSFWLVIINLIINPIESSNQCTGGEYCLKNIMWDNNSTLTAKKWDNTVESIWKLGSITMTHKWKINKETSTGDTPITDSIFWTIIFDILGILILWTAVIWALKWSELTASIVGKVADFWKDLWKYAPLPIPGGSIGWLKKWADRMRDLPRTAADERFKKSKFWQAVQEAEQRYSWKTEENTKANQQMKDIAKTLSWNLKVTDTEAEKWFSSIRNAISTGIKSFWDWYRDILAKLDIDAASKKMSTGSNQRALWMDEAKIKKILEDHKKWENIDTEDGKKIIAALGAMDKQWEINSSQFSNNYDRLRFPQNQEQSNKQTNAQTGPQPSFDKQNQILNMNNTNINLGMLGTDADEQARLERVANEVNKQYSWDPKDLEKLLKDLKIPDSEAEKISKKVTEIRKK